MIIKLPRERTVQTGTQYHFRQISPLTTHNSQHTIHNSPFTIHHSPFTTHHPDSSNVLYRPPFYRFVVISNTP
ncbi:MAG: hypothetical protein ACXVBX_03510 [Flavisolibacter sp.]